MKTVSSRLGRASSATTGNVCAHAISSAVETDADKLEDICEEKCEII